MRWKFREIENEHNNNEEQIVEALIIYEDAKYQNSVELLKKKKRKFKFKKRSCQTN